MACGGIHHCPSRSSLHPLQPRPVSWKADQYGQATSVSHGPTALSHGILVPFPPASAGGPLGESDRASASRKDLDTLGCTGPMVSNSFVPVNYAKQTTFKKKKFVED